MLELTTGTRYNGASCEGTRVDGNSRAETPLSLIIIAFNRKLILRSPSHTCRPRASQTHPSSSSSSSFTSSSSASSSSSFSSSSSSSFSSTFSSMLHFASYYQSQPLPVINSESTRGSFSTIGDEAAGWICRRRRLSVKVSSREREKLAIVLPRIGTCTKRIGCIDDGFKCPEGAIGKYRRWAGGHVQVYD